MITLFFGPLPEPITGQAISFELTYNNFPGDKQVFDYSSKSPGFKELLRVNFKVVFSFLLYLILNHRKISAVYLTTCRSRVGFFRDFIIICTSSLFKIKIINHLHGADFKKFRSNLSSFSRNVVDFVYKKIDKSIVLLPKMKEQYDMYPDMKVEVVSNCYQPFKYESKVKTFHSEELSLLYLSNIMYSKGILHLIEAVTELQSEGLKVKLHIAGKPFSDEYYSSDTIFKEFKTRINDNSGIVYHGTVIGKQKHNLFSESDVFVLPSFYRTEAQPISIIEAMAYGCAVICTDHNYLSDLVTEKNGLIVDIKSIASLKDAIRQMYNERDELRFFSSYNLSHAKDNFSPERYLSHVVQIISED